MVVYATYSGASLLMVSYLSNQNTVCCPSYVEEGYKWPLKEGHNFSFLSLHFGYSQNREVPLYFKTWCIENCANNSFHAEWSLWLHVCVCLCVCHRRLSAWQQWRKWTRQMLPLSWTRSRCVALTWQSRDILSQWLPGVQYFISWQTMEKLVTASKEELTLCPGLGPLKVRFCSV